MMISDKMIPKPYTSPGLLFLFTVKLNNSGAVHSNSTENIHANNASMTAKYSNLIKRGR